MDNWKVGLQSQKIEAPKNLRIQKSPFSKFPPEKKQNKEIWRVTEV